MRTAIEIILGLLIIAILALAQYSSHIFMPMSMTATLLVSLVMTFLVFVGLVWREQASDERDATHMAKAGRWSFFAGATIIVIGIAVQAINHEIDPWLLYALSGMVLTKLIARLLHHFNN